MVKPVVVRVPVEMSGMVAIAMLGTCISVERMATVVCVRRDR